MARKRNKIVYKFTNDHEDKVYRFEVLGNDVQKIFIKTSSTDENQITDIESFNEAMHCYLFGYKITKEQYDNYNPRYGLIACGLIENHTHNTHYNEKYYAKEREKGIKLGYIKEP